MSLRKLAIALAAPILAAAQPGAELFEKAPPAIDQALRDQVTKFHQLQAEGKFRAAEQMVDEESKDTYYESDKRRCRSFEIARIQYSENFSRASVVLICETEMLLPPRGLTTVKMPGTSNWKFNGGKWLWYVVKTGNSAFGEMKPGEGGAPGLTIPKGPDARDVMELVRLDRTKAVFSPTVADRQEVVVMSEAPGEIRLVVAPLRGADLKASVDRETLRGASSAKLILDYTPSKEAPRTAGSTEDIVIRVEPLGHELRLRVTFGS